MKKIIIVALAAFLMGCVSTKAIDKPSEKVHSIGMASFYGAGEKLAKHTANGDVFNPSAMTAAHRSLPFGTMVKVTNLKNGKSVVVRINDRGPFIKGRIIDLSRGSARAIGITGVGKVKLEIIKK